MTTSERRVVSNATRFSPACRIGLLLCACSCLFAGTSLPAATQIAAAQADSSDVYASIEVFSKKRTVTRFLHGLLLVPGAAGLFKNRPARPAQLPYQKLEGKIIRNIQVTTLDPFGYSVDDTAAKPDGFLLRAGNKLHVKSRHFTIKSILLFRKNTPFDSLLVQESARLVRRRKYVRDVLIDAVPVEQSADSIDMYIRVLDTWSIVPVGDVSPQRVAFGLTENNLAGFGHEFKGTYTWNTTETGNAFAAHYVIPNIRTSHIHSLLHYSLDEYNNTVKSVTVERPLFSPLATWAAGLHVAQHFFADTAVASEPNSFRQNRNVITQDYWAGKAGRIVKGNREDARTTNAIIAARYLRIRHLEKPDAMHDPVRRYADEDFYLAGIEIATLHYFQNNYIFDFGVIEDVPVGRIYGITGGYQMRNGVGRLYFGTRISFGDYTNWGYASSTFEYGTFFRRSHVQQGVFTARAHYASNLFEIGNWRIRQFAKPQLTLGMNRFSYDSLTINNENGIRGFNSSLQGTKKLVLTFQTQSYAPWNVLGFRFGPFLMCSFGMLGNATSGFKNSRVYSQFGLGALIKNRYFVLSNFQISIAYYPSIPGRGYDIFKLNAFETSNFGFGDFTYGKPEIVVFQ